MTNDRPAESTALSPIFEDHTVRIEMIDGEPWFCAMDVADCLGIRRSSARTAVSSLPSEDRDGVCLTDTMGRIQIVTFVSESGLYALIFQSRKQEAQKFQRWVMREVLPSIRKTGSYAVVQEDEDALLARGWQILAGRVEKAEERARLAEKTVESQQVTLEAQRPAVELCEKIEKAPGEMLISTACKQLDLILNPTFKWLRDEGHIFFRDGANQASAKMIDAGRMVMRRKSYLKEGDERFSHQLYLTEKGFLWLDGHVPINCLKPGNLRQLTAPDGQRRLFP